MDNIWRASYVFYSEQSGFFQHRFALRHFFNFLKNWKLIVVSFYNDKTLTVFLNGNTLIKGFIYPNEFYF